MDNRQLLCTFSTINDYKCTVNEVLGFYNVYSKRVFVFSNVNVSKELYLTYNVISEASEIPKFPNTISIHRKKQTSTLFTLNALNSLIKDENGGNLNKDLIIDWNLYKNSLILNTDGFIKVISIKIFDVIYS